VIRGSPARRFRMLFELAPDAIYLDDLNGNFADGNRVAKEITGYKREDLIGKSLPVLSTTWSYSLMGR